MPITAIKGMADLLPDEAERWQVIERCARQIFSRYHYREIRTPIVEALELFARTLGETTALVEKEMYTFADRHGKKLTLRPEGTASVVRAYIESHFDQQEPLARFFYLGPMYRYERPQRGRSRQFHQIGAEVIGGEHPLIDAEMIQLAMTLLTAFGIGDVRLEINSLGCRLCRPNYVSALTAFFQQYEAALCDDCKRRMKKNPLRVLDCKNETCRRIAGEAPSIQDYLCEDCEGHFDQVLTGLGHYQTRYHINPAIVRGLDYYQRTAFELTSEGLGAQNAVAGGGRYDGLVRLLGGPHVPGVGFAIGFERVMELLAGKTLPLDDRLPFVYIASMGEKAVEQGLIVAEGLRAHEVRVEVNYEQKGLKALMRRADKLSADYTVMIGDAELKAGRGLIRNMRSKEQEEFSLKDVPALLAIVHKKGG